MVDEGIDEVLYNPMLKKLQNCRDKENILGEASTQAINIIRVSSYILL